MHVTEPSTGKVEVDGNQEGGTLRKRSLLNQGWSYFNFGQSMLIAEWKPVSNEPESPRIETMRYCLADPTPTHAKMSRLTKRAMNTHVPDPLLPGTVMKRPEEVVNIVCRAGIDEIADL